MSRTRILITEVNITRAGQIKNFQIKLPKNAIAIVGVATDLRLNGRLANAAASIAYAAVAINNNTVTIKTVPIVAVLNSQVPVNMAQSWLAGKIILQSLEKANIFYSDQVWAAQFNDGIGNITDDMYAMDAFETPKKAEATTVSVPAQTTIINGIFKDLVGATLKKDIAYTIKVLLWIETDEKEITLDKK